MIKYKLTKNNQVTYVTLDTNNPSQDTELAFEGDDLEGVRDWLYYEMGLTGHFIGDSTSPIDLDSALSKQENYKVELLKGKEILAKYKNTTPRDRIT